MSISIEDTGPCKKTFTVTIPAGTLADHEKNFIREISKEVRIPGFRPGHAPTHIIRRQFNDHILEDLKEKALKEALNQIRDEQKIKLYAILKIEGMENASPGADLALRIELEHLPEFELPEYKNLELSLEASEVSEEEIQDAIDRRRNASARFEPVERPAEKGDYVKLSYNGTIDGIPVKEIAPAAHIYGTQNTTWEEVGGGDAPGIPEIVAGIVGKKNGDKAEFTHAFPEDFKIEALRGKTATYTVEIFEVRSKILPPLENAFFEEAGVKDLAELHERTRDELLDGKTSVAKAKQRQTATEKLSAMVDFPLPESAVNEVAESLFLEYASMQLRQGVDIEEIKARREEVIAESRDAAALRVKLQFILEKIAEQENIKVKHEDLAQQLLNEARRYNAPPEKYIKEAGRDRERLAQISSWILRNKALDLVIQNAKA